MAPIWHPQPKEVLVSWIDAIIDEAEEKLNDWERGFLESVSIQLERKGSLSQRQEVILERIYADKTS